MDMKTYRNIYEGICSYGNLELAYLKARKRKTGKAYVQEFEQDLQGNLIKLREELLAQTYRPRPLTVFMIRDPKTRKISASAFRDRVVHHALCNVIGPIFESQFIHDSFANQKGKGTHKAILRFEAFQRKVLGTGGQAYALKVDIRHYFDTVAHEPLIRMLSRQITDQKALWLIRTIITNHKVDEEGKGMPIGNLTSQFWANVYLHKLDLYVKHVLRAKYYIRYVDDFVILDKDPAQLETWKQQMNAFLASELLLEVHPDKSRILPLQGGVTFLGFRVFPKYKLLKKSNSSRIWARIGYMEAAVRNGVLTLDKAAARLAGWLAYAEFADTYHLRQQVVRSMGALSTKRGSPQERGAGITLPNGITQKPSEVVE